jgi:hypothetical protein
MKLKAKSLHGGKICQGKKEENIRKCLMQAYLKKEGNLVLKVKMQKNLSNISLVGNVGMCFILEQKKSYTRIFGIN